MRHVAHNILQRSVHAVATLTSIARSVTPTARRVLALALPALLVLGATGTAAALQDRTVVNEPVPTPYPTDAGELRDSWVHVDVTMNPQAHGAAVEVTEPWTASNARYDIVDAWMRVLDVGPWYVVGATPATDAATGTDVPSDPWNRGEGAYTHTEVTCDPVCSSKTTDGGCETTETTSVCESHVEVTSDDGEVHVEQRTVQHQESEGGGSVHQESHQSSRTVVRS